MRRFVVRRADAHEVERLRTLFTQTSTSAHLARHAEARTDQRIDTYGAGAPGQSRLWRDRAGHRLGGARHGHPRRPSAFRDAQEHRARNGTAPGRARRCSISPGSAGSNDARQNGHGTHVAGTIAGAAMTVERRQIRRRIPHGRHGAAARSFTASKCSTTTGPGSDSFIIKALDKIAEINEILVTARHSWRESLARRRLRPERLRLRAHAALPGVAAALAAGRARRAWPPATRAMRMLQERRGLIAANLDHLDRRSGQSRGSDRGRLGAQARIRTPTASRTSPRADRQPTGGASQTSSRPAKRILSAFHDWPPSEARQLTFERSLRRDERHRAWRRRTFPGMLAAFLSIRREFIGYPDRVKAHAPEGLHRPRPRPPTCRAPACRTSSAC